jgi:uncharacterized membrane protein YgcG
MSKKSVAEFTLHQLRMSFREPVTIAAAGRLLIKSRSISQGEKMKPYRAIFVLCLLGALLLSACGASPTPTPEVKVHADVVSIGTIESMDGTQWVVNGQSFSVEPSVVQDGPFNVGDTVKVEASLEADGSVVVTRVETPTAEELAAAEADDNSNDANEANANSDDENLNDANANDANANMDDGNLNDVNSNDANVNDGNVNDDNTNTGNANDDNTNTGGNDNTANDNGGGGSGNDSGGGGNDNGGGGGGGGNDNGGNGNGG